MCVISIVCKQGFCFVEVQNGDCYVLTSAFKLRFSCSQIFVINFLVYGKKNENKKKTVMTSESGL